MGKPILCLDFDGVLHSYTSGWVEADFIPDPPVPGAMQFLYDAIQYFDVQIFSSRSKTPEGIRAMRTWIGYWARKELGGAYIANVVINEIVHRQEAFPTSKPSAFLTIDDRAICFSGKWANPAELLGFKPWYKSTVG